MSHFSLKHLSARVPWHDAGWSGTVCNAPHLNGSCTKLKGISESKNTASEIPYAGISLLNISPSNWPCCVNERMAFMAPFDLNVLKKHALARNSKPPYGHFKPTLQRNPPYSLGIVPFRWMMRENLRAIGADYDLTIQPEPELGYKSNWVTGVGNQKTVLGAFTDHLRTQHSICLIYAKNVPFYEDSGRILVGVGRVTHIGELTQYNHDGSGMDGYIWERPVQHSIRPSGEDGFLMPYHELLVLQEKDSSLDMARYVAKAPEEHWDEFSYASELVTHDGAIAALLSLDRALVLIEKEQGINTSAKQKWIHNELVRLWAVRGPYPGMGAVLTAFGLSRGVFVAHALQDKAGENVNPWPLVELTFADPSKILSKELHVDIKELAPTWIGLPTERKAYLKLLSRFNLTVEQARLLYDETIRKKKGWLATDGDILRNPYRLYELTRLDLDGVPLMIIDRGIFPDDTVRLKHPLDQPSVLESAVDVRRIRAFSIAILENAAEVGHTLLPAEHIVEAVCQYPISPACPITHDMLVARVNDFLPDITQTESAEQLTFQLERYKTIRDLIRKEVNGRAKGLPLKVTQDWSVLLDKKFGTTIETEELQARSEKAAALKQLAESRFSVLVGPAGAGKTTVLGLLCAQAEIQQGGLLLLAPTGKARVRMQELAQGGGKAMTLAQFLIQNKRYDGKSARYLLNSTPKANGYETVIIDESSMLTEDMLGALFNALEGVKRYILVGDPAQLPPIGAGRPFVDIIEKLKPANVEALFPRIANGYSELTIERRQQGQDRADLRFVRWFSAMQPDVGGDDLFDDNMSVHKNLNFVSWQTHDDFREKLLNVLVDTLDLKDSHDIRGFNRALGAEKNGEYDNFNPSWGKSSSVNSIENWQILSPLRGMPIGVSDINRLIHERFRGNLVDLASRSYNRAIPKPMGSERIVYGDKVINLTNHSHDNWSKVSQIGKGYLANGEIGLAVRPWNPDYLNVEFASQKGYTYSFKSGDFNDEGKAALELAYALTIHKSQGSQFGVVIVVLPESHPMLSRELIYTALTRHQNKVIIMHQGALNLLKSLASPYYSETARRMTNLIRECKMVSINGPSTNANLFLQEGLVHRTSTGLAVRSKSELIICEALITAGINFVYEKPLTLGGQLRYPDFTIEDDISGRTYYWEHLGMLDRADYKVSWERKQQWYRENGVLSINEGGGENGILITSSDSLSEGFNVSNIKALINMIQE